MRSPLRYSSVALIGMLSTFCLPDSSRADFQTNLNAGNTGLSGYQAPFGSVDVHLVDSTHATVTLTSDSNGVFDYLFGGKSTLALNVNAIDFKVSNIQGSQPNNSIFTGWSAGKTSSGDVDSFGFFNLLIKSKGSFSGSVDELTLSLTNVIGAWDDASDVLVANDMGNLTAGHVFVWDTSATKRGNANPASGFAADDPVPAPAPSSLILLGIGGLSIGFVMVASKRRESIVSA
jgi:hypothetical protein